MEKRSSNWLLVLYGYLQVETRINVVRNKYWIWYLRYGVIHLPTLKEDVNTRTF